MEIPKINKCSRCGKDLEKEPYEGGCTCDKEHDNTTESKSYGFDKTLKDYEGYSVFWVWK